jgi:hypothetical protein
VRRANVRGRRGRHGTGRGRGPLTRPRFRRVFFFLRFFRRLGFVRDAGRAPAVVDSAYFWDSAMLEENRLLMSFCHVYRVISPGRSVL